ncbi:hypothetical protein [Corynebacterium pseudotuberculosis]|uniref:hypothetical protein n=1 Tax=Corynebacterium pseudotuberculosis TaxID=1719 RepID=UPI0002660583|nr:hypothetical protein [Corynebacterium pseudotuberculosis]AFM06742.1 hypothetical protein CP162_02085 [Corynebacterium pseudotuberculosis Cp162]APG81112.1 Hypothetical protein CPI37_0421 [Corynebacterium pseudotuberculosis]WFP67578.1 hypothetical protein P8128_02070 [Corynebacterium pseudotuberculosis]
MQKIKVSLIAGAVCCLTLGGSVAGASQVLLTGDEGRETNVCESVEKLGDTWSCKREWDVTDRGGSYPVVFQRPCTVSLLGSAYEKLRSSDKQETRGLQADLREASAERDHYKKLSQDQWKLLEKLTENDSTYKAEVEKLKPRLSGLNQTGR